MTDDVRIGFNRRLVTVALDLILPLRQVPANVRAGKKFKRIAASIAEVGVIEPLVVSPQPEGRYLLLDGHLRHAVLKDRGEREARCLVAADDEAFTYNKRVNRIATIQEYVMITRALDAGVPDDLLARSLNLKPQDIWRQQRMLDGICPEVVEMLKDKVISPRIFDILRKMKPLRQIKVTDLMMASATFTAAYAKSMLAATRQDELVRPNHSRALKDVTPEQIARMQREMESLQAEMGQIEDSYGNDVLHLVIARGYLAKLVNNAEIARYLKERHSEILEEFRSIVSAGSLDQSGGGA